MKKRKKGGALARRYGRFSIEAAEVPSNVRTFIRKHPVVSAAGIGATISAIGAGAATSTAALIGAMSTVTSQQILKWSRDREEEL